MKRVLQIYFISATVLIVASLSFGGYGIYLSVVATKVQLENAEAQLKETRSLVEQLQSTTTDSITNLKNKNAILAEKIQSSQEELSSVSLPKELLEQIMIRMVYINCRDPLHNTEGTGSGTIGLVNAGNPHPVATTNFHVLGSAVSFCVVNLPALPSYSRGTARLAGIGKFDPHYPDVDVALLELQNAPEKFSPFPLPFCAAAEVSIGDNITVLGYPAFKDFNSSQETLTVTNGIISGIYPTAYGPKYKTTAKMDHGVSGGLAVANKKKCVLGIPTWGEKGTDENIGLIQSWEMIKNSNQIF